MYPPYQNQAVAAALLKRFKDQRMPRAINLKKKVDAGEILNEIDLAFLDQVLRDAQQMLPRMDQLPEYQPLIAKAIYLYHSITLKALENAGKIR